MESAPATKEEFFERLTPERAEAVASLYAHIVKNLSPEFEESFSSGMIHFVVPFSVCPAGYHCDPTQRLGFCSIATGAGGISLHFMALYGNSEMTQWFKDEYAKTEFKLDMGAACIRFKRMDRIPFELIGRLVAKFDCQSYVNRYNGILDARKQELASSPRQKRSASNSGVS